MDEPNKKVSVVAEIMEMAKQKREDTLRSELLKKLDTVPTIVDK